MYRTIYGLRDYGAGEPECFVLRGEVSEDEKAQGVASLKAWLAERLSADRCIDEIHAMRACVRARAGEEDDIAHQMAVYAARCQEYPAAAVLRALREWPKRSDFFPTWNELGGTMQREMNNTLRQIEALERAEGEAPKRVAPGRGWHSLTEDEKQAHRQMMAETKRKMAEGEAALLADSMTHVLSPDQMAKIEAATAALKARHDAEGHEANKRRMGIMEPVENPVGEDFEQTAVNG